jgi:hypothetical protein
VEHQFLLFALDAGDEMRADETNSLLVSHQRAVGAFTHVLA